MKKKRLNSFISYISRGVTPYYCNNGIKVLNQKCIREHKINYELARITNIQKRKIPDEKYIKKYDILINSTGVGTLGRVAQVNINNERITIDSHVMILRPHLDIIDGKYFGYSLKMLEPIIQDMGEGATGQTELSRDRVVNELYIYDHLHPNQRKIASILSAYDDLIENNTKRIKILEEMAQKIYKEWFVDFHFPGYENVEFEDSELGRKPKGWTVGAIGNLNIIKGGYAFKSKNLHKHGDSGIIKIKNIQNNSVNVEDVDYIDSKLTNKVKNYILQDGDLLIAMTGALVGKIGVFPKRSEEFYLNQRVGKFVPIKDWIINNQFIINYCKTDEFLSHINNTAQGAAQPNISSSQIENIKIVVPDKTAILNYEKIVGAMSKQELVLRAVNDKLIQTRDILLPRLISGKLDVENLEIKL
jgi:type I restriction enzyme, S subunit